MAKNFRICTKERSNQSLALELFGDFDGSSACELINVLDENIKNHQQSGYRYGRSESDRCLRSQCLSSSNVLAERHPGGYRSDRTVQQDFSGRVRCPGSVYGTFTGSATVPRPEKRASWAITSTSRWPGRSPSTARTSPTWPSVIVSGSAEAISGKSGKRD